MKKFIVGLCWWLAPMSLALGHIYGLEWLFNSGIAACVILMIFSFLAAILLLIPHFYPKAHPSIQQVEDIKKAWRPLNRGFALFKSLVMVFLLAGLGWVGTAICYFMVTVFSWFSVHLLLAAGKQDSLNNRCNCLGCERQRRGWPGYQPCARSGTKGKV